MRQTFKAHYFSKTSNKYERPWQWKLIYHTLSQSLSSQSSIPFGACSMAILYPLKNICARLQVIGWSIQILGIKSWFCIHHNFFFFGEKALSQILYHYLLRTISIKRIGSATIFYSFHNLSTLVCIVYCILDGDISILYKLPQSL